MPEYWSRKLAYPVVPVSEPLRPTRTLAEARKFIDLKFLNALAATAAGTSNRRH
jgi:hypothetical protein